jgi:aminoacrylate peracid reductase
MFTTILPKGASKPIAPYAHATKAGNTVYVSGTLAIGGDGKSMHAGDMKAQTRYVIEQIKAALEAAGASLEDVAYNMIFIKRVSDYAALNEVYAEYFGKKPPARYCIVSELVRDEFLVEISSIAHIGPA